MVNKLVLFRGVFPAVLAIQMPLRGFPSTEIGLDRTLVFEM
jgi:hypothetical protein